MVQESGKLQKLSGFRVLVYSEGQSGSIVHGGGVQGSVPTPVGGWEGKVTTDADRTLAGRGPHDRKYPPPPNRDPISVLKLKFFWGSGGLVTVTRGGRGQCRFSQASLLSTAREGGGRHCELPEARAAGGAGRLGAQGGWGVGCAPSPSILRGRASPAPILLREHLGEECTHHTA
eukprot:gene23347-biopygen2830